MCHGSYGHFDASFLESTSCGDSPGGANVAARKLGGEMAQAKKKAGKDKGSPAAKRNFFATMSAEVIKAIKRAALEDDTTASEILEEAANQWLDRRKQK
jgi:hypothetical protein